MGIATPLSVPGLGVGALVAQARLSGIELVSVLTLWLLPPWPDIVAEMGTGAGGLAELQSNLRPPENV